MTFLFLSILIWFSSAGRIIWASIFLLAVKKRFSTIWSSLVWRLLAVNGLVYVEDCKEEACLVCGLEMLSKSMTCAIPKMRRIITAPAKFSVSWNSFGSQSLTQAYWKRSTELYVSFTSIQSLFEQMRGTDRTWVSRWITSVSCWNWDLAVLENRGCKRM